MVGGLTSFREGNKQHCTGDLLDVSAGREMYGPGGGYSLLAGHDVTRCLATMSLAPRYLKIPTLRLERGNMGLPPNGEVAKNIDSKVTSTFKNGIYGCYQEGKHRCFVSDILDIYIYYSCVVGEGGLCFFVAGIYSLLCFLGEIVFVLYCFYWLLAGMIVLVPPSF